MKKILLTIVIACVLVSCSSDDNGNENCRFLPNIGVNYDINLNFPDAQPLLFNQQPILIREQGIGGLVVMKTLGESYIAWDAADPNHAFSSCSAMTLDGTILSCNCDDENTYDVNTGLSLQGLICPLKAYRVERTGENLLIFN